MKWFYKKFRLAFLLLSTALYIGMFNPQDLFAQDQVKLGEDTFKSKGCGACHSIGKGKISGPDLLGVTERRDEEWLKKWLKNPDTMVFTDPIAKEMLQEYMVPMPNVGLTDEQVVYLIEYLKFEDNKNK
jgi:cytochrome c